MFTKTTSIKILATGLGLLLSNGLQAASLYWDGSGTSWHLTSSWSESSSATTPDPGAIPGASDEAIFNISTVNSPQTVNLNANYSIQKLTFNNTGTTLVNGGGGRYLLVGSGGLEINGGAGAVNVGGALQLNLRPVSSQTWINHSASPLTLDNSVQLDGGGNGTLTVDGSGDMVFSWGANNGSSGQVLSLTKEGAGMLTIAGNNANTMTGVMNVNEGVVRVTKSLSLFGAAGTINIQSGGTFEYATNTSGATVIPAGTAINVYGTGVFDSTNTGGSGNFLSGTLLTLNTTGAGANTSPYQSTGTSTGNRVIHTLNVTPDNGHTTTMHVGAAGVIFSASAGTVNFTPNGSGQFIYSGNAGSRLDLNSSGLRTWNINAGTGTGFDVLVETTVNGSTAQLKNGAGTLKFTGANATTGSSNTMNIQAGTVQYGTLLSLYNGNTANWTKSRLIVGANGTLAVNVGGAGELSTGNVTSLLTNLAGSTSAGQGLTGGASLGFDTSNASGGSFTLADNIANTTGSGGGAIGITKLGTGTLELTGNNTFTGETRVRGGTLELNAGTHNSAGYSIRGGSFTQTDGIGWTTDIFHIDGFTSGATINVADLADSSDGTSELYFTVGVNGVNPLVLTESDPFAQHYAGSAAAWAGEWGLRIDTDGLIGKGEYGNYSLIESADLMGLNGLLTVYARDASGAPFTYTNLGNNSSIYLLSGSELAQYKISLTSEGLDLFFQSSRAIPEPGTFGLLALGLGLLRWKLRRRAA